MFLEKLTISKNVVNVHLEADGNTELVTQAILGQPAWLLEKVEGWQKLKLWDSYTGWVRDPFVTPAPPSPYPHTLPLGVFKSLIADIHTAPDESSDIISKGVLSMEVELGESSAGWQQIILPEGQSAWTRASHLDIKHQPTEFTDNPNHSEIIRQAKRLIGVPYLWGGTTPFGIDCSGFVQLMYRMGGTRLLRDADIQANDPRCKAVDKAEMIAGDMVFFCGPNDTGKSRITHTGLYLGDGNFIHSSGKGVGVTISPLFEGYYWDVFWGARRIDRQAA